MIDPGLRYDDEEMPEDRGPPARSSTLPRNPYTASSPVHPGQTYSNLNFCPEAGSFTSTNRRPQGPNEHMPYGTTYPSSIVDHIPLVEGASTATMPTAGPSQHITNMAMPDSLQYMTQPTINLCPPSQRGPTQHIANVAAPDYFQYMGHSVDGLTQRGPTQHTTNVGTTGSAQHMGQSIYGICQSTASNYNAAPEGSHGARRRRRGTATELTCQAPACTHLGTFANRSSLNRHIESMHTRPGAFLCAICEQPFNRTDVLGNHVRQAHRSYY